MQERRLEAPLKQRRSWWTTIFRDVQFWVPLIVLLIGLLLLRLVR